MTITTITHTGGNQFSTDAPYRVYGSAISAAIATIGWVQTADTGQVNWSTVTVPAAGVFTNYEIWRANDALQATDPIFLRVDYARGSAGNAGLLRITAGTATDGAGTLTSAANTNVSVTAATQMHNGSNTAGTTVPHRSYVIGDTGSLVLFLSPLVNGNSDAGGLFCIERRRALDGTAAAGGWQCLWYPGGLQSTVSMSHHCILTHNVIAQQAQSGASGPALVGRYTAVTNDSGIRNNTVPLFPVLTGSYPELGAPSKWLLAHYRGDLPLGTTFQVTHYGETATFMSVGLNWAVTGTGFSMGGTARVVPAVRVG